MWKLMKKKWYHSNAKTRPKIFYLKGHRRGFYPKTRTKLLVSIKESTHETSDDFFYWQELYLGNNKITSLDRESFASMTSLSIFGIRDNKINR